MSSLQTFHPFTLLPAELRLKIWSLTVTPALIPIWTLTPTNPSPTYDHYWKPSRMFTFGSKRTPLLHICAETRILALSKGISMIRSNEEVDERLYPMDKTDVEGEGEEDGSDDQMIFQYTERESLKEWFRMDTDVLFIRNGSWMSGRYAGVSVPKYFWSTVQDVISRLGPEFVKRVQYIALDFKHWMDYVRRARKRWLEDFEALRCVVVVGKYGSVDIVRGVQHMARLRFEYRMLDAKGVQVPKFKFVDETKQLEDAIMNGKIDELPEVAF